MISADRAKVCVVKGLSPKRRSLPRVVVWVYTQYVYNCHGDIRGELLDLFWCRFVAYAIFI